jgi:hypothetical protein
VVRRAIHRAAVLAGELFENIRSFGILSLMALTDQLRDKLSQLPNKPGIYLMKDRFGRVIYVGKARNLRKRVSQYFHPSRRLGWD